MLDYFDPTITTAGVIFSILVLSLNIFILIYGFRNYRFFGWRYLFLLFGILCFELLTSSFWQIEHLGVYAYINGDISYTLTLFWGAIIL